MTPASDDDMAELNYIVAEYGELQCLLITVPRHESQCIGTPDWYIEVNPEEQREKETQVTDQGSINVKLQATLN